MDSQHNVQIMPGLHRKILWTRIESANTRTLYRISLNLITQEESFSSWREPSRRIPSWTEYVHLYDCVILYLGISVDKSTCLSVAFSTRTCSHWWCSWSDELPARPYADWYPQFGTHSWAKPFSFKEHGKLRDIQRWHDSRMAAERRPSDQEGDANMEDLSEGPERS